MFGFVSDLFQKQCYSTRLFMFGSLDFEIAEMAGDCNPTIWYAEVCQRPVFHVWRLLPRKSLLPCQEHRGTAITRTPACEGMNGTKSKVRIVKCLQQGNPHEHFMRDWKFLTWTVDSVLWLGLEGWLQRSRNRFTCRSPLVVKCSTTRVCYEWDDAWQMLQVLRAE